MFSEKLFVLSTEKNMSFFRSSPWGTGKGEMGGKLQKQRKQGEEEEMACAQWTHMCERLIQKSLSNHHHEIRPWWHGLLHVCSPSPPPTKPHFLRQSDLLKSGHSASALGPMPLLSNSFYTPLASFQSPHLVLIHSFPVFQRRVWAKWPVHKDWSAEEC